MSFGVPPIAQHRWAPPVDVEPASLRPTAITVPPSTSVTLPPAPPPHDGRAVVSLVLGALSVVAGGPVTGLPAIALGLAAKRDIDRASGKIGGRAYAVAGLAAGIAGTAIGVCLAVVLGFVVATSGRAALGGHHVLAAALSRLHASAETGPTAAVPPAAPPSHVVTLRAEGGTLAAQLAAAKAKADAAGDLAVVLATDDSPLSRALDGVLDAPEMAAALDGVTVVRVDVGAFRGELHALGMLEESAPWFYKVDAALHPADAIGPAEWDQPIAADVAPVFFSFVRGTLKQRRETPPVGLSI